MSTGLEKGYSYSRFLRISGDKKSSGNSNTDFRINLGQSLQNVKRVSFIHAVFANSPYNIIGPPYGDFNNNLTITYYLAGVQVGGVDVLNVPSGFYNVIDLIAYLNANMRTDTGTQMIVWGFDDSYTDKVTTSFYPTGTIDQAIISDVTNPDGVSGSIYPVLGFTFLENSTVTTTTAPNFPSLQGITEVYLRSSILGPGNSIDEYGDINNICMNIPITVPWGSMQVYDCKVDSLCQITYPTPRNIQTIDIQLVDRDGSVINLQGGNLKVDLRVWFDRL